jgi:uncharacterized protein
LYSKSFFNEAKLGKVLLWVIVILAALMLARILARANQKAKLEPRTAKPIKRRAEAPKPVESMVRCAHCGIHLPRSDALLVHGQTWCSKEHARLGPPK